MNKLILFLFLFPSFCSSQNLVTNGNFENYSLCPSSLGQLNLAFPWITPSTGSSDYFNVCSSFPFTGVPNNNWGNQPAHSGSGYAGIVLYQLAYSNCREYIEIPLSGTLKADSCYHFEMFINLGKYCNYSCNNMHAYFSDTVLNGINNYYPLNKSFQISYTGNNFDSTWTLVSGDYIAQGGEGFITIGNFLSDSLSNITMLQNSPMQTNVYVYIDDVSLVKTNCSVGIPNTIKNLFSSVYPNPFSDQLTFKFSNGKSFDFTLYDIYFHKILQSSISTLTSLNTQLLPKGIYFYVIRDDNNIVSNGRVVKH